MNRAPTIRGNGGNMAETKIPELNYLLKKVEQRYGRRISTSTDFEALSVVIDHKTGELVSASTLKRLWGYVSMRPTPRISTLDILSRYLGTRDFQTFCKNLKNSSSYQSTFFSSYTLYSEDLKKGQTVTIKWNPDRVVTLEYLGNDEFVVKKSLNSQLLENDRFAINAIIKDYPLLIPKIIRDADYTPSYIAGTVDGITEITVI